MVTMETAKEQSCWSEFISGSDAAFRMIYDAFAERLFFFGYNYCQDKEMVKDAIQDLFIDLHRYRRNLGPDVNLTAYLFSSMRRKLFAALKKSRQQESMGSRDPDMDFLMDLDTESSIIRNEQERELACLLSKEIEKLPGRQREVLYLRYTMEMNYKDIAGIMEISVATSRTLVYRAVRQLRKNMKGTRLPVINPSLPTLFS